MGNKSEKQPQVEVKKELKTTELKTLFGIIRARMRIHRDKKRQAIKSKMLEIRKLLEKNDIAKAKIKMEIIIKEEDTIAAYEILDGTCDILMERTQNIALSEYVPEDIRPYMDTFVWASKVVEVEEFMEVRKLITNKFGQVYISEADGNALQLVDPEVIRLLTIKQQSEHSIMARLKMLEEFQNESINPNAGNLPDAQFTVKFDSSFSQQDDFNPNNVVNQSYGAALGKTANNTPKFNQPTTNYQPNFNQPTTNYQPNFNQPSFNQSNTNNQPNFNQPSFNQPNVSSNQQNISGMNNSDYPLYPNANYSYGDPRYNVSTDQGNLTKAPDNQGFNPNFNEGSYPDFFGNNDKKNNFDDDFFPSTQ